MFRLIKVSSTRIELDVVTNIEEGKTGIWTVNIDGSQPIKLTGD